ncbi:MAG: hypothetical protein H6686_02350 [Fibrobacteria bacterium]|nr:hypothetical protein [Fibrobacteria bacterium]
MRNPREPRNPGSETKGRIVFLTAVWAPGYGVSVVIAEQCRLLRQAGWDVLVAAIRAESGMPPDIAVIRLPFRPLFLRARLEALAPSLVVACTFPFPQALAGWGTPWVHWDHGRADQPEGELAMETSASERVGPSRWLVGRFRPAGVVVANGGDHLGRVQPSARPGRPIRVVAALRSGAVESLYKGNGFLRDLPARVGRPDMEWVLMLRGDGADGFRESGWRVSQDPSRREMASVWTESDIHLAPSRIESFDLPLAEAQHLGCAGWALEGGAHGELTPWVFPSEEVVRERLLSVRRDEVDAMRLASWEHVGPWSWHAHGEALRDLVQRCARPWVGPVRSAPHAIVLHRLAAGLYDLARRILR